MIIIAFVDLLASLSSNYGAKGLYASVLISIFRMTYEQSHVWNQIIEFKFQRNSCTKVFLGNRRPSYKKQLSN